MTRREFLALAGAPALSRGAHAREVSFGRVDAHAHIYHSTPSMIVRMQKEDWRVLTICAWGQYDDRVPSGEYNNLDDLLAAAARVHRESQGQISWAATVDARRFEERDFTEQTIAGLNRCFRDGALGVKIWRTIGMKIRGKAGNYLMPDDPTLMPIYEAVQKAGRTLIVHVAEPDAAWLPLDSPEARAAGYTKNSQWRGLPGAPSKETILAARDRILARFPKLRVIGCHLGSNEEDFQRLAKRLDTYPNFSVDMAARTQYFFDKDPRTAREFLARYQDRILYGSDHSVNRASEEQGNALLAQEDLEWNLFAGAGMLGLENREVRGLQLPGRLLRKLFRDNAARMLPGITAA